jgi:hypothetical protein
MQNVIATARPNLPRLGRELGGEDVRPAARGRADGDPDTPTGLEGVSELGGRTVMGPAEGGPGGRSE